MESSQKSRIEELKKYTIFLSQFSIVKLTNNLRTSTLNFRSSKKTTSFKLDDAFKINVFEIDRKEMKTFQEIINNKYYEKKFNFLTQIDHRMKILENALLVSGEGEKNNDLLNSYKNKEEKLAKFISFLKTLKQRPGTKVSRDTLRNIDADSATKDEVASTDKMAAQESTPQGVEKIEGTETKKPDIFYQNLVQELQCRKKMVDSVATYQDSTQEDIAKPKVIEIEASQDTPVPTTKNSESVH